MQLENIQENFLFLVPIKSWVLDKKKTRQPVFVHFLDDYKDWFIYIWKF